MDSKYQKVHQKKPKKKRLKRSWEKLLEMLQPNNKVLRVKDIETSESFNDDEIIPKRDII